MAEKENNIFTEILQGLNPQPEPVERPTTVGVTDYLTDIPVGIAKGASQAIKGLFQLGAIPIDYIADTNLLTAIDEIFPKITTDTVVGDVVSTLVQFGVPLGVGVKVANGMMKLNKFSDIKKLSSIPTLGGKAAELGKRTAFYGPLGGVTDFVASTPGDLRTLSSTFGFGEDYKGGELSGSAKAAEAFKEKIKFGAEGAVLGGGLTAALPVAGTLGTKYGLIPAAKGLAVVGGQTLRAIDFGIVNPLTKVIGSETVGKGVKAASLTIDNNITKLRDKLNIPKAEDWKFYSANPNAPLLERLVAKLNKYKNSLDSDGPLDFEAAELLRRSENIRQMDEKTLIRLMDQIDKNFKDLANDFNIRFTKNKDSELMLNKYKDDMFDYLETIDQKQADKFLKDKLPVEVQADAKALKTKINELGTKYGALLEESPVAAVRDLGASIKENGGAYLKQVFTAFKNKDYRFDPTKIAKAKNFFLKNVINKNKDLLDEAADLAASEGVSLTRAKELLADANMEQLKRSLIQSNRSPDTLFKQISKTFRIKPDVLAKDVKTKTKEIDSVLAAGENVRDVLLKQTKSPEFKAVADAFLEPSRDYRAAVTDTFMQIAKGLYRKKFFDRFAENGLRSGLLFRSPTSAIARGKNTDNLQQIVPNVAQGEVFQSTLFNSGRALDGGTTGLYTTPEIANAIRGLDEGFTSLYDLPLYKALMSVKSAGQIGKTVFSPMTQIRNVSTASFFALASGLIGGKASLRDAFKLMADDIFPGKNATNAEVLNVINDKIRRGILDQNVEVNEIKNILQKSKGGRFDLNTIIQNPTVKRAFDLYQGGDNVWKTYADEYYQSVLNTAFKYSSRGQTGNRAILENMADWYRTVAKEPNIADDILNGNLRSLETGQVKNAEEIMKDISAYLVTNTIPTYSKVPGIIKAIRNLPIGNFVAFPAEILRTSGHLLTIGARELTSSNPFIRQMGARRLLGTTAVFGGVGAVIQQTAEKLTGVDEKVMESFQRSFGPIYQKNSTLIPLTKPNDRGEFKYFNFSYTNPYDSLIRPVNAVLNAYANGQLTQQSVDQIVYNALIYDRLTDTPGAFTEFLTPFVTESIGTEAIGDLILRGGKTRDGKTIFFPQDSFFEKLDSSLGHLFAQLEPGATRSARRVYKGATGSFNDYGTLFDTKTEATALLTGLRVETAKPLQSFPFVITSYNKDKANIRRKFSRNAYNPNISEEQRLGAFREYLTDSFDSQARLHQIVKDGQTMGIDETDIEDILQDRLKNKREVSAIMEGEYRPPSYSEKRFDALLDRLEEEDADAAGRVESQIDNVRDIMDDAKLELEGADLTEPKELFDQNLDSILTPSVIEFRTRDQGPVTPVQPVSLPVDPRAAAQPNPNIVRVVNPLQTAGIGDILRQQERLKLI